MPDIDRALLAICWDNAVPLKVRLSALEEVGDDCVEQACAVIKSVCEDATVPSDWRLAFAKYRCSGAATDKQILLLTQLAHDNTIAASTRLDACSEARRRDRTARFPDFSEITDLSLFKLVAIAEAAEQEGLTQSAVNFFEHAVAICSTTPGELVALHKLATNLNLPSATADLERRVATIPAAILAASEDKHAVRDAIAIIGQTDQARAIAALTDLLTSDDVNLWEGADLIEALARYVGTEEALLRARPVLDEVLHHLADRAEAETIAAWIVAQRAMLEAAYPGQPLDAIIGIATPFAAQVRAIRTALHEAGIETASDGKGVTVGSVHAFQGGQRPVMLFSPVYSKHADSGFIDASRSVLNVAVSRAMNSFLVFGDMDCFSTALAASPRGRLACILFADDANAVPFAPVERPDLASRSRIEHLRDAADHDRFLREVLAATYRDIHIVTPWLTWHALRESDISTPLAAAIAPGKTLTVYTDPALNAVRTAGNAAAQTDLTRAITTLQGLGVAIIEVRQVHSKVVMADDEVYCVGSFNWLSAARTGALARHETSLAYHGKAVAGDIEAMKASLEHRAGRRGDRR